MYEVRTNDKKAGVAEFEENDYISMLKALELVERSGMGKINVIFVNEDHLQFEVRTPIKKVIYYIWKFK